MPDSKRDFVEGVLAYRLGAVDTFNLILRFLQLPAPPELLKIYFDDKLCIIGRAAAFTNPVIEAGIIHSRALLEFIGLAVDPADHTKLIELESRRRKNDVFIEDFTDGNGATLPRVTPIQAVVPHTGDNREAQRALTRVFHVANKGLAHSTDGIIQDPDDLNLLEIASQLVRALLTEYFYNPRGLTPPASPITPTPRPVGA